MAERRTRRPAAWMSVGLVSLIALVVVVLSVLALQRAQNTSHGGEVAPVPTFSLGVTPGPSPSDGSTPGPTGDVPSVEPVERSAERFLATGGEGVLWRGIAGSCADEATPVLERSIDGGSTWTDVAPYYLQVSQLAAVEPADGTQATIIASVGPDCVTQGLATFTDGEFWEPYEDVLASATFLSPADPAELVAPGATVEAPCDDARGARGSDGLVALVCDGEAQYLADGEWASLGVNGVVAVATLDDGFVVAHAAGDCDGLAISMVLTNADPSRAACAEGLDSASPTAIAAYANGIAIWNGDEVETVTLDG